MKRAILAAIFTAVLLAIVFPAAARAQKKGGGTPAGGGQNGPVVDACSDNIFNYFECLLDDTGTAVGETLFPNPNYGAGQLPLGTTPPAYPPTSLWDTQCDSSCLDNVWDSGSSFSFPSGNWDMYFPD